MRTNRGRPLEEKIPPCQIFRYLSAKWEGGTLRILNPAIVISRNRIFSIVVIHTERMWFDFFRSNVVAGKDRYGKKMRLQTCMKFYSARFPSERIWGVVWGLGPTMQVPSKVVPYPNLKKKNLFPADNGINAYLILTADNRRFFLTDNKYLERLSKESSTFVSKALCRTRLFSAQIVTFFFNSKLSAFLV